MKAWLLLGLIAVGVSVYAYDKYESRKRDALHSATAKVQTMHDRLDAFRTACMNNQLSTEVRLHNCGKAADQEAEIEKLKALVSR
jgi:uncharacterized protein (DUF2267 family)